jgi:hypothetical protein
VFPFSRLPGRASVGKILLLPTAPAFKGLIGGIGKNLSTKGILARKQALWLSPAGKLRASSQFHSYIVNRGEGGALLGGIDRADVRHFEPCRGDGDRSDGD